MEGPQNELKFTAPATNADIEALVAMLRNWGSSGFLQEEPRRKEAENLDEVLDTGLSKITDESVIRELPHSAVRLKKSLSAVLPTLEKFSQLVAAEVKNATRRSHAMSLMCGIALLSDCVLSYIFDIVVDDAGLTRATTAVYLARVSKRFRSVALSNHSLWSFIYGSTKSRASSLAHSKLCIERSAQAPLEITYNAEYEQGEALKFKGFINALLPHVGRWKSFTLEFRGDMASSVGICNAIANLEISGAPNLEKLGILSRFSNRRIFDPDVPIPFSKWSLPRLEQVQSRDFKIDIASCPSIERVSQTVSINFPLTTFLTDLMALKSLRYLYLGLFSEKISQDLPRLDLPSVTELNLYLRVKYTKPYDVALSAINCPNVTDLTFRLLFMLNDEDDWGGNKMEVTQHYVRHFFSRPERFRNVRRLALVAWLSESADVEEGDVGHMLYALSMASLPSLRHLDLEGPLASLRPHVKESYAQAFEIDEGETYPAIETISVRRCIRPERLHYWLAKVKEKLEKQGDWERCFRYLILQGKRKTAVGVTKTDIESITQSEISEWISSNNKMK